MPNYKRNHYVPIWYQQRFFPSDVKHHRLYYLNLKPEIIIAPSGHKYYENEIEQGGPKKCFYVDDLYTTKYLGWESVDIEKYFFGKIDSEGKEAVEYFSMYNHSSIDHKAFNAFIKYLSVQKLRTPKGLSYLSKFSNINNKNVLLIELQRMKDLYAAIWCESVWSIVKANSSNIKFIISDHPVTVYNMGCFPGSKYCINSNDPLIWMTGTHTIFPFDYNTALILTNVSWLRNPYSSPLRLRPNPQPLRDAMFSFLGIQINRELNDIEVASINYIIKKRAYKYVAAMKKEWLYPETIISSTRWDKFGKDLLLMPDPRSHLYSTGMLGKFENGITFSNDIYGRPNNGKNGNTIEDSIEWNSFHAFIGEFARKMGPKRRGITSEFGRLDDEYDSVEMHKHNIKSEGIYKSKMKKSK